MTTRPAAQRLSWIGARARISTPVAMRSAQARRGRQGRPAYAWSPVPWLALLPAACASSGSACDERTPCEGLEPNAVSACCEEFVRPARQDSEYGLILTANTARCVARSRADVWMHVEAGASDGRCGLAATLKEGSYLYWELILRGAEVDCLDGPDGRGSSTTFGVTVDAHTGALRHAMGVHVLYTSCDRR